jgi:hypothetical protein
MFDNENLRRCVISVVVVRLCRGRSLCRDRCCCRCCGWGCGRSLCRDRCCRLYLYAAVVVVVDTVSFVVVFARFPSRAYGHW